MRNLFQADNISTASKGTIGMVASGGSAYVSTLQAVEAWLRVASLLVGIAVGVATLISIIRKMRRKA